MAIANQNICIGLTIPVYVNKALNGLGKACQTSCGKAGTFLTPKQQHHVTLQVLNGLTQAQVAAITASIQNLRFIPFKAKLCKNVAQFGQAREFVVCPVKSVSLVSKKHRSAKGKSPRSYNFLHQEIAKAVTPILGNGIGAGPQFIPHCSLGKIANPGANVVLPMNKADNVTWTVTSGNLIVL